MLHKVIIGEPSRYLRMTAFACVMILSLCASATEYFVDKNRPDDNGDGKSIATAYRTIQAAVDNAKNGDIITVLPGVYDEGGGKKIYTSAAAGKVKTTARVVLDKSIWLRSAEGKEKTFIVGSRIANGDETDMRCVSLATSSTIVEGFTICGGTASISDGTASETYGGGVLAEAWGEYYIADCIVSNNIASVGAGICRGAILRCLVANNTATMNSSICRQSRAIHSIFRHNYGPASSHQYCYDFINCTVFENKTAASANYVNSNLRLYNCLFAGNTGVLDASKKFLIMTNCVIDRPSTEFIPAFETVFQPDIHQFCAPIFNDLRPLEGSVSATGGNAQWLENFAFSTSAVPEWSEELAKKYRYKDFCGNPIAKTGTITCGAIQTVVKPAGGRVDFAGSSVTWQSPGIEGKEERLYAYAASYPTQFCARAVFKTGKSLFMYEFDPSYEITRFFPEMDGYFRFVPPPQGSVVTLKPTAATYELYADDENGDDANDGSSWDKAFKTLQAAINAASGVYDHRTLIHVAPGYYDEGGNFNGSCSNRIDNLKKTLYIRGEEGPEKTFIVGAPDPDTKGLGPNAVRCVKWSHGGNHYGCLQGFTLTGGHTDDGTSYAESRIVGGYYGSFEHVVDCIISNNHAVCASAAMYGVFARCKISDNTAKVSWAVSYPKMMSFCSLERNTTYNTEKPGVTRGGYYRFCTIDGIGFSSLKDNESPAVYYGCIFGKTGSNTTKSSFEDCFAAQNPAGTEIPGITTGDPCLVGENDCRLLSVSPAYGAVSFEKNPSLQYSYFSSDLSGCSPYWNGAAMTAGAYSLPLQAFSVKRAEGCAFAYRHERCRVRGECRCLGAGYPAAQWREVLGLYRQRRETCGGPAYV